MTSIYRDASNSYIPFSDAAFIARDKLKGDDVEAALREARKAADMLRQVLDSKERQ
jgi:hypothetical protein